jgi:hypothetical protein
MPQTFVLPRQTALDDDANPLAGAPLYFFQTGTTTPQATYQDAAILTSHSNPVVADSSGEFAKIYLNPNAEFNYRARLTTATGVQLWQEDDIDRQATISQELIAQTLLPRTTAEIAAGVIPSNYAYPEGHLCRYMTTAQRTDYIAKTLTLDLTTPIQNMLTVMTGGVAYMPEGFAKITSALSLPAATTLRGDGVFTRISAYGCDAISIAGDFAVVERLQIHSFSAVGSADPLTNIGIKTGGVSGSQRNSLIFRDIYLRGFLRCFDLTWTWTSILDNCVTQFCTYGVRLFGQSVNNHIVNCHFETTAGTACIYLQKDTGVQGEGLFISATFMAAATNAILSDGFLSLGIDAASMVDLITGIAFDFTGVQSFKCDAQWVYADSNCFMFRDPGAPMDIAATICIGRATTAGASSTLLQWSANNRGLTILGGEFNKTGASGGYPLLLTGSHVSVMGSRVINASSNPGIRVAGSDTYVQGVAGATIEWATSPIPSVASASTVALPVPRTEQLQIVNVTGTTTINNINDPAQWAGKAVALKFEATVQLVNGAALKLAGAANFNATAEDMLTLVSDGTAWREAARSVN